MNSIGSISYGIGALAFALLTLLLIVSWRGQRQGAYFIAASAITALWATYLAVHAGASRMSLPLIYLLEVLRSSSWLLAISSIAGPAVSRGVLRGVRGMVVLSIALGILLLFIDELYLGIDDSLLLLSRTGLVISLTGLILLEQVYRNAGPAVRGALGYLALGVGGLFAYDLFLYSQAELLRGISADVWNARGFSDAIAVPLIAIAVRRAPQWSLDVFVSRQAVIYTASLISAGAYLVVMALGGFYVREFGGSWGRLGQIVFFAGALVVLAFLLGSESLRRHARVFISKHFYSNKYDYRIEWLRFIGTLSVEQDEDVRRTAVRAIAQIFSSPGGVLLTIDEAGKRFVPAAAWPMRLDAYPGISDVGIDEDLPRFLARTQWIIDLREIDSTPDRYENLGVPEWIKAHDRARILSPLLQLDRLVGFVLLDEPAPPFELTYEDRDLLKTVGRHVATHLAQHEANRRLAEVGQFEAYNRLTAFLMHDLKNSVAQLSLLIANASRHKRNPEFIDDAIDTIANTVQRMTRLIEQLKGDSPPARKTEIDLAQLAKMAVSRCTDRMPNPLLREAQEAKILGDPERITAILEHLIRNAQDASAERDSLTVDVRVIGASAALIVTDTGAGMEPGFVRERLFRPFDSTKGSKGMGIGAYQVREYVRMLGGQVDVQSSPGKGTTFSITLPTAAQPRLMAEIGHNIGRTSS